MKQGLLYLLLTVSYLSFSQMELGLDVSSGFGLNHKTEASVGGATKTWQTVTQVGLRFQFGLLPTKKVALETGLYAKYIRATGEIGTMHFTYNTLRLLIPVGLKFNLTNNWNASAGVYIQNNRDFENIIVNQAFNFRFDGYCQVAYQPTAQFAFSVRYQRALSNLNSAYFINDAQNAVLCGITCYFKSQPKR